MLTKIGYKIKENGEEITGYLVIDSMIDNSSSGGLRIGVDVNTEVLTLLARNMTLKYGFLGIPQGGAKAGVLYDLRNRRYCNLYEDRIEFRR